MIRVMVAALALVLLVLAIPFGGFLTARGASSPSCGESTDGAGSMALGSTPATAPVSQQQIANAKIIDQTVQSLDLPGRATFIALVAAVGESSLINVNYGDTAGPDSRGLFQQRSTWGTEPQRMDPAYATTSFLLGPQHDGKAHGPGGTGLVAIPGWQTMTPTQAIHAVQINADPNHYTQFVSQAQQIAARAGIDLTRAGSSVTGAETVSLAEPNRCAPGGSDEVATLDGASGLASSTVAAAAVAKAKSALGTPYVFGGGSYQGPTRGGFDCSSYVAWAYYQASGGKIQIGRTTYDQSGPNSHMRTIPLNQVQAGDLIYVHVPGDSQTGWNHVVMSLGGDQIIEEPRPPLGARVMNISEYSGYGQMARRVI